VGVNRYLFCILFMYMYWVWKGSVFRMIRTFSDLAVLNVIYTSHNLVRYQNDIRIVRRQGRSVDKGKFQFLETDAPTKPVILAKNSGEANSK
jgi:hypothetical protein